MDGHVHCQGDHIIKKLGCNSVKLQVSLDFLMALSDFINFGWCMIMLGIMGDHYLEAE